MKIIAELGSNHKSLDDCKNAISLAHAVGADAIKFQLYTHQELYGFHGDMPGEMPREWIPILAEKARAVGIEFMCTAFSPDGVRFIDPYVKTHKLASSEMCHIDMLAALIKAKKPVLVSTGGQVEVDIIAVAKLLKNQATFLYCEASYPARHVDIRKLPLLERLVKAHGCMNPVGFSDHTTDVFTTPVLAARSGATVLEKHFNPFDYDDTPDAGHSLGVDDFRSMVRAIHDIDKVELRPTREEQPMTSKHKRRLIVTRDLEPGDTLVYNQNFGVYRSKENEEHAYHPACAHQVNGKKMATKRKVGDGLGPRDIAK